MKRPRESADGDRIPQRKEMEARLRAMVVVYERGSKEWPGGMCGCCGGGPIPSPNWRADPWYVYRAGICDADGVYYSMLCEGCLEDIREANARRPQSLRDEVAREMTELLGDDIDGAQSMMDDWPGE